MNPETFHRLHGLRMDNDAARYAMADMRPRFETMRHRHTNGTAPRAVSAYQLFQTPPTLARDLVSLLDLTPGQRILEPSAGLGRILDALADHHPAEIVAVEQSPDLTRELFDQNRPGVTIKQRDFLACTPADLGTFDAVAMNPPFHMRADLRHIQHARHFLRPGGRLAGLCMATHHRADALKNISTHWQQLPAATFAAEGTRIETFLFSIET